MAVKPRATDALLGKLHEKVAKTLLERVTSGDCTPADLNAAIKFLQNNKIEAISEPGDNLDKLLKALPTFEDDEEYVN